MKFSIELNLGICEMLLEANTTIVFETKSLRTISGLVKAIVLVPLHNRSPQNITLKSTRVLEGFTKSIFEYCMNKTIPILITMQIIHIN
jgi:hypothetical protein